MNHGKISDKGAGSSDLFGFYPVGSGRPRDVKEAGAGSTPKPIEKSRLLSAIHRSAGYLIKSCAPSGRFVYLNDLDPRAVIPRRYNIIRHAGAMFALGDYARRFQDRSALAALITASRALEAMAVKPLPGRDDMLAVWSNPPKTNLLKRANAKLGGAGLGLLALCKLKALKPSSFEIGDLERLGNFILFMQKENGAFQSKFDPAESAKDDEWESLYYPGEAALGLIALHELSRDAGWIEAANRALIFLAEKRKGARKCEHDHWALMAISRLLRCDTRPDPAAFDQAHIDHAALICRSILWDKPLRDPESIYYGAMTRDGRVCPTATRLEGLIAALEILPKDLTRLRHDINSAVSDGMRFLLANQITKGKLSGAFPRSPLGKQWFDKDQGARSVEPRATEIRIDYVQHGLSAMMEYQELGKE